MNARWERVSGSVTVPNEFAGVTRFLLEVIEGDDKFSVGYLQHTQDMVDQPAIYGWQLDRMVADLDREIKRVTA